MNEKSFEVQVGMMARKLHVKKGDFLVVRYDREAMGESYGGVKQAQDAIVDVAQRLTMHPALKGVFIVTMPDGMELEHLPPTEMEHIGWIRKELAPKAVWLTCDRCKRKHIGTSDMVGWRCQTVRQEGVCDGTLWKLGPREG